jgi:hypothetical protein
MRLRMNDYERRWDNSTRRWIYTHREVMEKCIGRKLLSSEHIHHKDGNHLNNDISNLEITNLSNHMSEHKPVYKRKSRPVKRLRCCSDYSFDYYSP